MDYKTPKNKIQQNTKTRRATTQTTFGSDLIEFFGDDSKEIRIQIEKRNIYICQKYFTN